MDARFQLVEAALVPFASLLAALAGVRDPRRAQGRRYGMQHLLLFSVLAVPAGATSYQGIITFIALQRERLNVAFGARFRRAPAVNTLRHPFPALGRDDLEAAFRRHAGSLSAGTGAEGMRTLALDGEALRGGIDHPNDRAAAHVLSAFAGDAALVPAHREPAGAPDEIAAVPRLIAALGLTGVLFTADAPHRHKEGFARAAETGNALLVRVKDNQPTPHAALAKLRAEQRPFDRHETVDRRRHGRQEHRCVEAFDADGRPDAPWQASIARVARVSRLTHVEDTRSGPWPTREEVGYYACQTRGDAEFLARAIRAHWGIENRAHYVRDVTLGEDGSRIRNRPGVMARIRSLAPNILRANGVQNVSQALYANALSLDRLLALGAP